MSGKTDDRSVDRRRSAVDRDQGAVDDLRHALKIAGVVPLAAAAATPIESGSCVRCGGGLYAPIALCPSCGEPVPDHEDDPLYLVIRSGPERPLLKREAARLLTEAGPELTPPEVGRQLRDLPALFRAPMPDTMAARLAGRLQHCGYRVEVRTAFPRGLGFTEYLQSLWSRKRRLLPYLTCGALAGGLYFFGHHGFAALAGALVAPWFLLDRLRFLRRLTLSAPRLAPRLDMAPADVTDLVGALLRDGALSARLREMLRALLGEYTRVLDTLGPMAAPYPGVVQPMRHSLAQLVRHAARMADRALAVEKGGDFGDPGLEGRLADLRALGAEEIESRAARLFAARDERQGRLEWLNEVYGTLLIRIESITDTLRSVRQRILETYVTAEAEGGSELVDTLVATLKREEGVVSATLSEMERLDRDMPGLPIE